METFIHKYRPKYFKDFYLNDDLNDLIQLLFAVNSINILLIGDSSSGKTCLLNIILREYYELGPNERFSNENILFVNNLKEQGIQYFRTEMKTFCQSQSTIKGKKKFVVIDDIDNINDQCQQVFRNYIDKYGNNIHFISSCTNAQKVIESLQSRLHLLKLSSINNENLKKIMHNIKENEKLQIDDESIDYLISITNNSIHQIVNYFEKIYILNQPVNIELCKKICSNIYMKDFEDYIQFIKSKNLIKGIECLQKIYNYGYSVIDILDYFFFFVKRTESLTEDEKYIIIPFLCKYITIFNNVHENKIELTLLTNNLINLW